MRRTYPTRRHLGARLLGVWVLGVWVAALALATTVSAVTPAETPVDTSTDTPADAAARGPEIEIGMSPQEITVGDRVVVEISIALPAGSELPVFPEWSAGSWGSTEVLEAGEVQTSSAGPGLVHFTQRLVLTAFEVGELELPPLSIELPRAEGEGAVARSDARLLRVRSVRPEGERSETVAEPRPPAGLKRVGNGAVFWWTLGLVSLATGLVIARLLRDSPPVEIVRPRLDPLDEFDRLVRDLGREADPIAFHTRLSFALRHFLGRTLGFSGVESTTTEIQRRLRQHQLAGDTVRHTSQLLRDCDQVKFARILAGQQSAEETLHEAGRVARSVYRDVRAPEAEPTEGAPA